MPDIVGVTPAGMFLGIEVKTKTGKVSAEQRAFLDRINGNNGIGFVARSVQDVIDKLDLILGSEKKPTRGEWSLR